MGRVKLTEDPREVQELVAESIDPALDERVHKMMALNYDYCYVDVPRVNYLAGNFTRVMQSKLFVRFNIFGAWTIKELSPTRTESSPPSRSTGATVFSIMNFKISRGLKWSLNCSK